MIKKKQNNSKKVNTYPKNDNKKVKLETMQVQSTQTNHHSFSTQALKI